MIGKLSERDHIHEYVVRRLRILRCNGEPVQEQERIAKLYERHLAFEWRVLLAEAKLPGPFKI